MTDHWNNQCDKGYLPENSKARVSISLKHTFDSLQALELEGGIQSGKSYITGGLKSMVILLQPKESKTLKQVTFEIRNWHPARNNLLLNWLSGKRPSWATPWVLKQLRLSKTTTLSPLFQASQGQPSGHLDISLIKLTWRTPWNHRKLEPRSSFLEKKVCNVIGIQW